MRLIQWLFIYIGTFGLLSITVKYKDGLHIRLKGWPDMIMGLFKKKK
jgi:hypothetical protein